MGENKEISSDAKNTAKEIIESIVDIVLKTISKQTDSFDRTLEEMKVNSGIKREICCCGNVKDELIENPRDLEIQDNLCVSPHLSEICCPSFTNLPDVCIQCSKLSTLSPQGEGDFQPKATQYNPSFEHPALEMNKFMLDKNQDDNSITTISLTSETLHSEICDNLHNNIYNLSFDDTDNGVKHETIDSDRKENLENMTSRDFKETLDLGEELDGQDNTIYISDSETETMFPTLKKSKKFWHYNNTQNFPAWTDQISSNYCGTDENTNLEGKQKEELLETSSQTSEELAIVYFDAGVEDCVQNVPLTNPFKCPIILQNPPLEIVPVPSFQNLPKQTKSHINSSITDTNLELKESLENEINLIDDNNPLGTEDMENDLFKTRQYWSNVGLITENKINRKCVSSIPDNIGIESICNMTPVKETCFKLSNIESDFHSTDKHHFSQSRGDYATGSNVNYLSFPKKADEKKKKKSFVTRITDSVTKIFRFKKNAHIDNKD